MENLLRHSFLFLIALCIGAIACGCVDQSAIVKPVIKSVTGELSNGAEITIVGTGFGSGPHIVLYDRFEGGGSGDKIPLTSPTIGVWSMTGSVPPVYSSYAHTGTHGFLVYDGLTDTMRQLRLQFPADQEIFVSYWVFVPPGTRFPGTDGGISQFSTDSSWKFVWLMDGSEGYHSDGKFDICLPTYIGHGLMGIAGNDGRYRSLDSHWWSWHEWMRVSIWLKGSKRVSNGGESRTQTLSKAKGLENRSLSGSDIFLKDDNSRQFNQLNVPGWIRRVGGDQVQPVYDDIYVAVGPASFARVELTNNKNYELSTDSIILIPVEWTDTKIVVKLDYGNMNPVEPLSIHVFADGGSQTVSGMNICTECE